MSKKKKIAIVIPAVLVIIGVCVVFSLCYKGLLGFYHPQKKALKGQKRKATPA